MAKLSRKLLDQLSGFLLHELSDKALQGITYSIELKDERGKDAYERYKEIKKEALACGYSNDEVFRIYEVSNGYIFDMDLSIARKVSQELLKGMAKLEDNQAMVEVASNNAATPANVIEKNNGERVKADLASLANDIKQAVADGKQSIDVALFSRNSVPRIVINGIGPNKEPISIKYKAYAVRHYDLESINSTELIPAGVRVYKFEPREVLPSRTGVLFRLYIEKLK